MDNSSTIKPLSELQLLQTAITRSNYTGMRSVADLQIIETLCTELELYCGEACASSQLSSNDLRQIRIIAKVAKTQRSRIAARIKLVTRMNESRYRVQRAERSEYKALREANKSNAVSKIIARNEELESQLVNSRVYQMKLDSASKPIINALTDQVELEKQTAQQAEDITDIINRYQINKDTSIKAIDSGKSEGSAEDWLK